MVMVQDDESARFSGMPDSAGATGLADYVLPPEANWPIKLLLFIRHPLVALIERGGVQGRSGHDAQNHQSNSRTDRH